MSANGFAGQFSANTSMRPQVNTNSVSNGVIGSFSSGNLVSGVSSTASNSSMQGPPTNPTTGEVLRFRTDILPNVSSNQLLNTTTNGAATSLPMSSLNNVISPSAKKEVFGLSSTSSTNPNLLLNQGFGSGSTLGSSSGVITGTQPSLSIGNTGILANNPISSVNNFSPQNQNLVSGNLQTNSTYSGVGNQAATMSNNMMTPISFNSGQTNSQMLSSNVNHSGSFPIQNQQNSAMIGSMNQTPQTSSYLNTCNQNMASPVTNQLSGQYSYQQNIGSPVTNQPSGQYSYQQNIGSSVTDQQTGQYSYQRNVGSSVTDQQTGQYSYQRNVGSPLSNQQPGQYGYQQNISNLNTNNMSSNYNGLQQLNNSMGNQQQASTMTYNQQVGNVQNQPAVNQTNQYQQQNTNPYISNQNYNSGGGYSCNQNFNPGACTNNFNNQMQGQQYNMPRGNLEMNQGGKQYKKFILGTKETKDLALGTIDTHPRDMAVPSLPCDTISDIKFNPKSSMFAVSSWDGTVCLYDIQSNNVNLKCKRNFENFVYKLTWDKEGRKLFLGTSKGSVHIWNVNTDQVEDLYQHTNLVSALGWFDTSTAECLMSGSWDNEVVFFRDGSATILGRFKLTHKIIDGTCLRPLAAVMTQDRRIHLYQMSGSRIIHFREIDTASKLQLRGFALLGDKLNGPATKYMAGSIAGRIIGSHHSYTIRHDAKPWSIKVITSKAQYSSTYLYGVNSVSVSPCFTYFAVGSGDGYVTLWETSTRKKFSSIGQFSSPVTNVAFDRLGEYFVYATGYDWSRGYEYYDRLNMRPKIFVRNLKQSPVIEDFNDFI